MYSKQPAPLIIEFSGGLGNQLFQFAFGIYLQQHTKRPLLFDATAVHRDTKRSLLITQFDLDTHINTHTLINTRKQLFSLLGTRIATSLSRREKLIGRILPYTSPTQATTFTLIDDTILAPQFFSKQNSIEQYATHLVTLANKDKDRPVYIRGYWQYAFFYAAVQSHINNALQYSHTLSSHITKHIQYY